MDFTLDTKQSGLRSGVVASSQVPTSPPGACETRRRTLQDAHDLGDSEHPLRQDWADPASAGGCLPQDRQPMSQPAVILTNPVAEFTNLAVILTNPVAVFPKIATILTQRGTILGKTPAI